MEKQKSKKKLNSCILLKESSWFLGSYKTFYYLCSGNELLSNVHGIVLWFRLQLIFYYFEPAFHKVIPEVVAQSLYNPAYDMQMRIAVVYAADTIDGCFVVHAVRLYRQVNQATPLR